MELCQTEQHKKNITDAEKEEVRKYAVKPAPERMDKIQKWMESSKLTQDPVLKEFGIKIDVENKIEVDGRIIPAPDIQYGNNKFVKSEDIGQKGSWNHSKNEFVKPTRSVINWGIINTTDTDDNIIESFIETVSDGNFQDSY